MCSRRLPTSWDFSFAYLIRCFVCINSCNCASPRTCFDSHHIDYNSMTTTSLRMEPKVGSIRLWLETTWNSTPSWVPALVRIITVRCSVGWIHCGSNGTNSDSPVLNLDFCSHFRPDWVETIWRLENCRCQRHRQFWLVNCAARSETLVLFLQPLSRGIYNILHSAELVFSSCPGI